MALKDIHTIANNFTPKTSGWLDYKYSFRVWTRGDGVRYKDMDQIVNSKQSMTLNDEAWDYLLAFGAKRLGMISGEFSSSPRHEAYELCGCILVKWDTFIEVGSKGRLKNSSVWNIE